MGIAAGVDVHRPVGSSSFAGSEYTPRAMALGHLVPARPEDPGRLAHHPEE
jgi:hypothetical protein